MDTIFIRELRLQARVGLRRYEKAAPQMIEIDLEIGVPGEAVFKTGKVADTIDYSVVVDRIRALIEKERFGLVESLAERLARLLIDDFGAPRVKIGITKLGVLRDARRVGVIIERSKS